MGKAASKLANTLMVTSAGLKASSYYWSEVKACATLAVSMDGQ